MLHCKLFYIMTIVVQSALGEHKYLIQVLDLLAKIKELGVLPAHLPLVLDAGTVLVSVPVEPCRFCLLSLHREVGGVRQYTR